MVRDVSVKFGEDAGKIWNTLFQRGRLSKDDLLSVAGLDDFEFQAGLGWLAREGKVSRVDDVFFMLGSTNLTEEIGFQAGRVWRVLDIWGEVDFVSLGRLSGLSDGEVYRALGWLAREGKVVCVDDMFSLR